MSLTLNTYPADVDNSGEFNITTDLVEDSSHVNLRVRADITVSAVVVATVEKPKGVADFDFYNILKDLVPGLKFARNSGDIVKTVSSASVGCPLVPYTILFTEVWEDSTGTLTTGDTDNAGGTTFRFVPADPSVDLNYYVLHTTGTMFANQTLRNNAVKFYTVNPVEMWIVFFTDDYTSLELFYSKDGAAYAHDIHITMTEGWGVIILNPSGIMSGVTSNLRLQMKEQGTGVVLSEVMTINVDNTQIDERVVLEYDGIVGGKEYLAFEGIKDKSFSTSRDYYSGPQKNRKGVKFFGVNNQKIETRLKDINNAAYLEDLLMSENVKKMELSYATPTEVTVITDNVKTASSELFVNSIDIEYEY